MLSKTFATNLKYLEDTKPELYQRIIEEDTTNYTIIQDGDEYNIALNNKYIYPKEVEQAIDLQFENFINEPDTYFKFANFSTPNKKIYIHDKYISMIQDLNGTIHNSTFAKIEQNFLPCCIISGIGMGKHISKLTKDLDIKKLFILDQDYKGFKISMHFINWREIFECYEKENYELTILINQNPLILSKLTLNHLYKDTPFLLNYLTFYGHFNSNFFTQLRNSFKTDINHVFTGLGFFDDEFVALKQTIDNIKRDIPLFTSPQRLPIDSNVLIIGSGPSIDNDIDFIKKNRLNTIIFSCGTALEILYHNNIIPDYHFEIERTPNTYKILKENYSKEYLKEINFIGLNLVDTLVFKLFKSSKIVLRKHDSGSNLFIDNLPKLDYTNPTVVNFAVNFASELGFNNIYLFGVDLGFKNEDNHHSKDSGYFKSNQQLLKTWKPDTIMNQKFPTNFDSTQNYYSTPIFIWAKTRLENCIKNYTISLNKKINYINCSDGISISHTQTKLSKNISLSSKHHKESLILKIESSFSTQENTSNIHSETLITFQNEKQKFLETLKLLEDIIENKSNHIVTLSQLYDLMIDTTYIINNIKLDATRLENSSLTLPLLRGTFSMLYSIITTQYLTSKKQKEDIHAYTLKYFNVISLLIKDIYAKVDKL